ncbi:hypothetical protein HYR54_10610 [Candidatus Acetothermia bacterium]|nr:hypothetical protein [Candidatus Acetothermia bacterium]
MFKDIKGILILVFDSCFSGGLDDGTKDLLRATGAQNIILLQACSTNQTAKAKGSWPNINGAGAVVAGKHGHGVFTGGLIEGLSDSMAGAGPANADTDPNPPSLAEGRSTITLKEWFNYAVTQMPDYALSSGQTPEFAPMTRGGREIDPDAGSRVIFAYRNGTTNLSAHRKHEVDRNNDTEEERCGCTLGFFDDLDEGIGDLLRTEGLSGRGRQLADEISELEGFAKAVVNRSIAPNLLLGEEFLIHDAKTIRLVESQRTPLADRIIGLTLKLLATFGDECTFRVPGFDDLRSFIRSNAPGLSFLISFIDIAQSEPNRSVQALAFVLEDIKSRFRTNSPLISRLNAAILMSMIDSLRRSITA